MFWVPHVRTQKPVVVHLLTADLRPDATPTLRLLLNRPEVAEAQHVCHLGGGRVTPLSVKATRVHAPAPLRWLRELALRRQLARLGLWDAPRSTVLHAWSPQAAAWARGLRAGHRPLLVEVDPGDDLRPVARWSATGTLALVCRSNTLRDRLLELGISPVRIRCIRPPAANPPGAPARRAATRQMLGLSDDHGAVLVLPPLTRAGGGFIAAWAALLAEKVRRDVRLVLPADGPDTQRVRRLIEDCRHSWMVRWGPPHLPLEDMLTACDVAAFTPVADAPLSGLAATIVAGIPVVAAAVPTVLELLDRRTGRLCRPGDPKDTARALLDALEHPDDSHRRAQQAQDNLGPLFADEAISGEYANAYARLAERRPVGAP